MRLSYREKQSLYHSLAQLLRGGIPFPSALDKLALTGRSGVRRVVSKLRDAIAGGASVGDAFRAMRPAITPLEANVVAAVERSGRLDHGLQQLAGYFEALARARETILRKSAYPLFVLHFGIFLLGIPTLLASGTPAYLREIGGTLFVIYGIALALGLVIPPMRDSGATSAAVDRLLRSVPLVGKVRRSFALSRFCLIYDVQLDAGVNVIDALLAASGASRSGMVRQAVAAAVPEVRTGSQVGPLLAGSDAFPEPMTRAFLVAEETGSLDTELQRMAADFQSEALTRLETAAEWLTKLLYLAVVLYMALSILRTYQNIWSSYQKVLDI